MSPTLNSHTASLVTHFISGIELDSEAVKCCFGMTFDHLQFSTFLEHFILFECFHGLSLRNFVFMHVFHKYSLKYSTGTMDILMKIKRGPFICGFIIQQVRKQTHYIYVHTRIFIHSLLLIHSFLLLLCVITNYKS